MIAQLAAALQQQVFLDPEIDGNHLPRLAESLLTQPEPAELTDNKLMDIACATDLVYYVGEGCGFASRYMEETDITAGVLAFARAAIAADRARRHG
jgi:hypothetical protein